MLVDEGEDVGSATGANLGGVGTLRTGLATEDDFAVEDFCADGCDSAEGGSAAVPVG